MYYRSVYAYHCRVVTETVSIPSAAAITTTAVAVAVINTAIKTYVRPPVTGMKSVNAAVITPIGRRPVKAGIWRGYPNTRYPVIAAFIIIIGPITGLPYITIYRSFRLLVNT